MAAGSDVDEGEPGQLKAPFAVKVVSRDVPHKTEAGGVKLGVSREGLAEAARTVTDNAQEARARRERSTACWCRRWPPAWRR